MSKPSFIQAVCSLDPAGRNGLSTVLKQPHINGASLLQKGKEGQAQQSCTDSHVERMLLRLALTGARNQRQRVLVILELCQDVQRFRQCKFNSSDSWGLWKLPPLCLCVWPGLLFYPDQATIFEEN